jgi:hypothetical protein
MDAAEIRGKGPFFNNPVIPAKAGTSGDPPRLLVQRSPLSPG